MPITRESGRGHFDGFDESVFKTHKTGLCSAKLGEAVKLAFGFVDLRLGVGFTVWVSRFALHFIGEADKLAPHRHVQNQLGIFRGG